MDLFRVVDRPEWESIMSLTRLSLGEGLIFKQFWRELNVANRYASKASSFYPGGHLIIQIWAPDDLDQNPDVDISLSNDLSPLVWRVSIPETRLVGLKYVKFHGTKPVGWP